MKLLDLENVNCSLVRQLLAGQRRCLIALHAFLNDVLASRRRLFGRRKPCGNKPANMCCRFTALLYISRTFGWSCPMWQEDLSSTS